MADRQHDPAAPTDRRAEMVRGLRDLADLLEKRPNLPVPYHVDAGIHVSKGERFAAAVHTVGAANANRGDYVNVTRTFGPVCYRIQTDREVRECGRDGPAR